jgi:hypothetical protein
MILNPVAFKKIKKTYALGVYCFIASKPSDWVISKKEIMLHFECGSEHIDTCLKYLKELDFITNQCIRDKQQKIRGWRIVLNEID